MSAVENKAPRKGIVGIDFKGNAGLASEAKGFGGVRILAKSSDRTKGKVKRIKSCLRLLNLSSAPGRELLAAATTFGDGSTPRCTGSGLRHRQQTVNCYTLLSETLGT